MTGTLTTYLLLGNLYTTAVADDTLITDALVLTASTLIVLGRTEDALAEQTVALGLVGAIVDGLRLGVSSGDARPMVIFWKLLFIFVSFLKAIFQFLIFNL